MTTKNDAQELDRKLQDAWRRDGDPKPETANTPAPKQDGANPFASMPGIPPTVAPKQDSEPNPFERMNQPGALGAGRKDSRESRQDDGGRG